MITTNLERDELAEQISERTVSRLEEMCDDPLPLLGADQRRTAEPMPAPRRGRTRCVLRAPRHGRAYGRSPLD